MDDSPADPLVTADAALHRLIEGNARYRAGHPRFTGMRPEMLAELSHGQQPFATILGCADALVPPELIFDAVLGELFVIRVAGHIHAPDASASLDYAHACLDTPLLMVLGHEGCGAVRAALESRARHTSIDPGIEGLVAAILPALTEVNAELSPEQQLSRAVEANVRLAMTRIADSTEGRRRLEAGRMMLVGAVYEEVTGRVRLLDVV
ncbi:carbonic anhydrase [Luteitalea sp.]